MNTTAVGSWSLISNQQSAINNQRYYSPARSAALAV
jgi:hypothetical protein